MRITTIYVVSDRNRNAVTVYNWCVVIISVQCQVRSLGLHRTKPFVKIFSHRESRLSKLNILMCTIITYSS